MIYLLVAVGGATGSVLRLAVGRAAIHLLGPGTIWGTFFVNVTGSFALGLFLAWALQKGEVSADLRAMIAIGLLGGYTTFSTLSYDTIRLLEAGEIARAGVNIAASLVVGLVAAFAGILAGRALP